MVENISLHRDKISIKLLEAEEKEKILESKERYVNELFKNLKDEQKEAYEKLEAEYFLKLDRENFSNTLDQLSNLKMQDIIKKITLSQPLVSKAILTSSKNVTNNYKKINGRSKSTIDKKTIKEKLKSNGLDDNIVGKIRKSFKKDNNMVLDGLNITGNFKCKHVRNKSHIPEATRSVNSIINRSETDLNMSSDDIGILRNCKLNKTFYLIQNKRIEQQMNASFNLDYSSVCGPNCCNKLKKNYEVQHNAAINRAEKTQRSPYDSNKIKRKKLFNGFVESKMENDDDESKTNLGINSSERTIKNFAKNQLEGNSSRSVVTYDVKETNILIPLKNNGKAPKMKALGKVLKTPAKNTIKELIKDSNKQNVQHIYDSKISTGESKTNLEENKLNTKYNRYHHKDQRKSLNDFKISNDTKTKMASVNKNINLNDSILSKGSNKNFSDVKKNLYDSKFINDSSKILNDSKNLNSSKRSNNSTILNDSKENINNKLVMNGTINSSRDVKINLDDGVLKIKETHKNSKVVKEYKTKRRSAEMKNSQNELSYDNSKTSISVILDESKNLNNDRKSNNQINFEKDKIENSTDKDKINNIQQESVFQTPFKNKKSNLMISTSNNTVASQKLPTKTKKSNIELDIPKNNRRKKTQSESSTEEKIKTQTHTQNENNLNGSQKPNESSNSLNENKLTKKNSVNDSNISENGLFNNSKLTDSKMSIRSGKSLNETLSRESPSSKSFSNSLRSRSTIRDKKTTPPINNNKNNKSLQITRSSVKSKKT